jgi:hypothetical protein
MGRPIWWTQPPGPSRPASAASRPSGLQPPRLAGMRRRHLAQQAMPPPLGPQGPSAAAWPSIKGRGQGFNPNHLLHRVCRRPRRASRRYVPTRSGRLHRRKPPRLPAWCWIHESDAHVRPPHSPFWRGCGRRPTTCVASARARYRWRAPPRLAADHTFHRLYLLPARRPARIEVRSRPRSSLTPVTPPPPPFVGSSRRRACLPWKEKYHRRRSYSSPHARYPVAGCRSCARGRTMGGDDWRSRCR